MKISELIKQLEELKKQYGDLPVRYQTLTHNFEPEAIGVKDNTGTVRYILLNP